MSTPRDVHRKELLAILADARTAGFLGPGPVETHLDHADGFVAVAETALGREPRNFVDLGSGGGVPGLVLALSWTSAWGVLLDSSHRRCTFLAAAAERLGVGDRINVVERRGEDLGRDPLYREAFELVTARSFAAPAPTAEIAAGLVGVGGFLVVSEPPEPDPLRWPPAELLKIGFDPAAGIERGRAHYVVVQKKAVSAGRFPRAVGKPGKRPLW